MGFGSQEAQAAMVRILAAKAPEILNRPQRLDIPYTEQVNERVCELVDLVHRNPECKGLQNIYTDMTKQEYNALVYDEDDGWVIGNWDEKKNDVFRVLYDNLKKSKLSNKDDVLLVIKQIFVLGGCGTFDNIQKIPDKDIARLYLEIGKKLCFDTITL